MAGLKRPGVGTTIDKLYNSPITLSDNVYNLAFPIRERLAPAIVIMLIGFWARLRFISGNIFEAALGWLAGILESPRYRPTPRS